MEIIRNTPTLAEQVYRAILDEICAGSLQAGAHLVQEQLAAQFGVSRQPVQQAMALLKADGIVEEVGKRGLRVVDLDLEEMRYRYDIRAALDELAARGAALRVKSDKAFAAQLERRGREILSAGQSAVKQGWSPTRYVMTRHFMSLSTRHPAILCWPVLRNRTGDSCAARWVRCCGMPNQRRSSGASTLRFLTPSCPATPTLPADVPPGTFTSPRTR